MRPLIHRLDEVGGDGMVPARMGSGPLTPHNPMALEMPIDSELSPRRLVLVDFDWSDADLLPRLLHHPGATVRLVAGAAAEEAGMRLAELCGLPRTLDIADLTREIFDVALVSERSPRRTQIEGLLLALGTPSLSPQAFLDGRGADEADTPAVEAPIALHAAAFETALGGGDFDEIVELALPDLDGPTAPTPVRVQTPQRWHLGDLRHFPTPEDRHELESALQDVMKETGAGCAELHVGTGAALEMVVHLGPDDAVLKALVSLASELGSAQVMSGVVGQGEGRTWGAWPFRTSQRRGVLAAAGMASADWKAWQRTVDELKELWDEREREQAAPAFPMLPDAQRDWLEPDEFSMRLELALERNRRDGLPFSLHRLRFPTSEEAVDQLAIHLPGQLRDTDSLCRPVRLRVLLLTATPRDQFPHVRRRILALWQSSWMAVDNERPIPGITEERIEMNAPEDGEAFLARAASWLAPDSA